MIINDILGNVLKIGSEVMYTSRDSRTFKHGIIEDIDNNFSVAIEYNIIIKGDSHRRFDMFLVPDNKVKEILNGDTVIFSNQYNQMCKGIVHKVTDKFISVKHTSRAIRWVSENPIHHGRIASKFCIKIKDGKKSAIKLLS